MNRPSHLADALADSALRAGEACAIRSADGDVSFAELHRCVEAVAAGLQQQGVGPGDRLGLYCVNCTEFVVAYFATLRCGATVVPMNLLLGVPELRYILEDSQARGLIYHVAMKQNADTLVGALPSLAPVVCIGGADPATGPDLWAQWLAHPAAIQSARTDRDEALASILYTSGTTGRPKGAMLRHGNLLSNALATAEALALRPREDNLLVVLPMFHAFAATVGMIAPLVQACSLTPLPRFDPASVAQTIAAKRATVFLGVPSMYASLLRLPDERVKDFAGVRFCVSGGAAMPQQLMRDFETRFGVEIYEGDGPTECGPVTCVNPVGGRRKPGSLGLPIPGVEMKIVDAQGAELNDGEHGEICVRSPGVMQGYWHRPQETDESFFDDWFRTGDVGSRDEDGYFFIVDRIKDMIIVNGMNVYPRMIEEVLYRHAGVREAAVVGEPDPLHGEVPIAFVVLEQNTTSSALRDHCRTRLGRHQIPRKFVVMEELPKNAAGKVLKRELRKKGEWERGVNHRR